MKIRVPPGRGGRLWLRHRIETATRAADLLDHKRRELQAELRRLRTVRERATTAWRGSVVVAEQRMGSVDAAGGSPLIRLAAMLSAEPCQVEIEWRTVMGVHYPTRAKAVLSPATALGALPGGAALSAARDAYRHALELAIAAAAADAAFGKIQAELIRTSRALRALEQRAIPTHQVALSQLEMRLAEVEREDIIRVRWASGRSQGQDDWEST